MDFSFLLTKEKIEEEGGKEKKDRSQSRDKTRCNYAISDKILTLSTTDKRKDRYKIKYPWL